MPPGPVNVTRRAESRSTICLAFTTSVSRPMSGALGTGRFEAAGALARAGDTGCTMCVASVSRSRAGARDRTARGSWRYTDQQHEGAMALPCTWNRRMVVADDGLHFLWAGRWRRGAAQP